MLFQYNNFRGTSVVHLYTHKKKDVKYLVRHSRIEKCVRKAVPTGEAQAVRTWCWWSCRSQRRYPPPHSRCWAPCSAVSLNIGRNYRNNNSLMARRPQQAVLWIRIQEQKMTNKQRKQKKINLLK
jgi:hypothetical protein